MRTSIPRVLLAFAFLASTASVLLASAQDTGIQCSSSDDCAMGSGCARLRVSSLGLCIPNGEFLSPCELSAECGTLGDEQLTCRTLGDAISGTYCARAGTNPIPTALSCKTDSNTCASGTSCLALTASFGSIGVCIATVGDPDAPACTIGGVACPAGKTCTAATPVIGSWGVCVDDTTNPSTPDSGDTASSAAAGPDTGSAVDGETSGKLATCSCSCNGMLVPGYMSWLAPSCDKCNSACWSALFYGCTINGWNPFAQSTILKGVVFGQCISEGNGDSGNPPPTDTPTEPGKEGEACSDAAACDSGLVCTPNSSGSGGRCFTEGTEGAACWTGHLCNSGDGVTLVCLSGRCAPDDGSGGMDQSPPDAPPSVPPEGGSDNGGDGTVDDPLGLGAATHCAPAVATVAIVLTAALLMA